MAVRPITASASSARDAKDRHRDDGQCHRLAGYEVYRFGGAELIDDDVGRRLLGEFFDKLRDNRPQQL